VVDVSNSNDQMLIWLVFRILSPESVALNWGINEIIEPKMKIATRSRMLINRTFISTILK
jgi:hypothetical protein